MQGQRDNPWVMVTGATGGIGKALIARLALRGQNVVATNRNAYRRRPGPDASKGFNWIWSAPRGWVRPFARSPRSWEEPGFRVWSIWRASLSKAHLRRSLPRSCGERGTLLELGGGLTAKLSANVSLYANADYEFAIGNANGDKRNGARGTLGLRYAPTFGVEILTIDG